MKLSLIFLLFFALNTVFAGGTGPYSPAIDVKVSVDQCAGVITYSFLYLNDNDIDEYFKDEFKVYIAGTLAVKGVVSNDDDCSKLWLGASKDYCVTTYNSNIFSVSKSAKANDDYFIEIQYKVPESKLGEDIGFRLEGYWRSDGANEDFTGDNAIRKTVKIDNPSAPTGFSATTDECNKIILTWTKPSISCNNRKVIIKNSGVLYPNLFPPSCVAPYTSTYFKYFPDGKIYYYCLVESSCCYILQISKNGGVWVNHNQKDTHTDNSVLDGVDNAYRIRTKYTNAYGRNSYSDIVSVTGNSMGPLDPPSGLIATGNCDAEVDLTWDWSSETPFQFQIKRSTNSSSGFIVLDNVSGDKRNYKDTPPSSNTTYYYRIRTRNTCDELGAASGVVAGLIPTKPNKPSDIISSDLINGIKITWNDNSNNETGFLVKRSLFDGGGENTFNLDENSTSFLDTTASSCQQYYYEVFSVNDCAPNGISGGVIQAKFVPDLDHLLDNTILKASKGYFSNRVDLIWENVNDNSNVIDFYKIYRKILDSDKNPALIASLSGEASLYSDVNADAGVIYEYKVVGIVECGDETFPTDTLNTYGFRAPTGDIYGRVTFENGQAEQDVELILETTDGIVGKSINFTADEIATIDDVSLLKANTDSITLQAWVSPNLVTGVRRILEKRNMYVLSVSYNHFRFNVGGEILNSNTLVSSYLNSSDFIHITAVKKDNKIFLYINGQLDTSKVLSGTIVGNDNPVKLGRDFSGAVDEVRVWNKALSSEAVLRDYNRYITGGEEGLLAYWSFNYATSEEFYDRSYDGSVFNENHGHLNGTTLGSTTIPTNNQLGYKGVTGADGSYSIRAIPYIGNGSVYTIIPRKGSHAFESQREIRFIGEGSQSHTVNFIDKSSFKVTGTITYKGGTIPVEGVSFTIDGVVSMGGNGTVLMTNAQGEFEIEVPVGSHEVIAVKANHIFDNGGRITDSYGIDRNYQDDVLGLELQDITTVKYIGRVAGGAIQDAFPLGFSLSENNLADGTVVILTTKNPAYEISSTVVVESFDHLIPSNQSGGAWPKTNNVRYGKERIRIFPNVETGEFIAEIIPETFTVTVSVPGHDNIPGSGEDLDLTQKLVPNSKVYDYVDSTQVIDTWIKTNYSDTVFFNASQKFIKRYSPTVRISQVDRGMNVLPFFGDTAYTLKTLVNSDIEIDLYPNNDYLFNTPVFKQNVHYTFMAEVYEEYIYKNATGDPKLDVAADEVPTQDATIEFINNLSISGTSEVDADDRGVAFYNFQVTEPELTSSLRAISAKIYYGNEDNRTSINWNEAFNGVILGAVQTGRDFVTGGPDKVLMVLRDPSGSNSYSYLEKGVAITESSTYNGNVRNTGSESFTQDLGAVLTTWTGVGAGVIQSIETSTGFTLGIVHEETVGGSNTSETTTTTTTRFQTSSDPLFVGAEADVFVGYSTNIAYGSTECVSIVSKSSYEENTSKYEVYTAITPLTDDWLLVKQTGLGLAQTFGTLFAFPQKHIVDRLLPEMEALRNNFLMQQGEAAVSALQLIANQIDTVFYVSYLSIDDPNYGKSNSDDVFDAASDPDINDDFNGASYRVVFPERDDFTRSDTILYLNQSIDNWYTQLAANEEAKINANLMQNYSFQGGSPVSYSESLSSTKSSSVKFDVMIGGNFKNTTGVSIMGSGFNFTIDETITTSHGGEFGNAETESHSKGFVLEETRNDYISVDVMYEDAEIVLDTLNSHDNFYPTFIFRTQAGATACPYEGEHVTQYFEAGQHVIDQATKKIEVPEIAVELDFIENVPSGGAAYFTLYLRNNSEINQDNWFTLKVVEESNPDGAKLSIDGGSIGNGKDFLVPAGGTLVKTLEVGKGSVLNYDNLKVVLESQCQRSISDTLTFTVHFIPSCSDVEIKKPSDKWTYNTKLPMLSIDGVDKHYMETLISGFDVNYDCFNHIKLQYKSSAESDDGWNTLMKYYSDWTLYTEALEKGNAEYIDPGDAGEIKYILKMDDLPDQRYDLRAVSVCLINNEEIQGISETVSGIKDMLCPRLFGAALPANGILTIVDEIRLNFNEQIAEGYLTKNNFQVTGIRNGTNTDHSVSISLDGENDFMATEFEKNMASKDITVEMWIKSDISQNATLFSHGNINESIEMSLTSDNHLKLMVGGDQITSQAAVVFEAGSWAHIAFVYDKAGYISAYYNFTEVISRVEVQPYTGIGNFVLGHSINSEADFYLGRMHNVRVWTKTQTSGRLQINSLAKLSGNETDLFAYYPMREAKGIFAIDKARGANMIFSGCTWSLPEGRATEYNGIDSYLTLNTGSSAVIDETMDYSIEFWFKGDASQTNATLIANGRGDGQDFGGSNNLFSIGFDENGTLAFANSGIITYVDGDYLDDDWHHFALTISRVIGRGQIYVDGDLKEYFDSEELEGIASAYMYLGARAWYALDNSSSLIVDNFFKGKIDEFRIWDLYKSKDLIQNNNAKLDGEEMGLLAYYPFEYFKEWQGTKELSFTLADMKVQSDPQMVVPDAISTGVIEASDIALVKNKGPVSDLEFDFVVNNDALIINLKESWEKIEKTIITFTADGIRDMNGNENVSPITWSAFIDRNQLKWSEKELDISKLVNDPLEFVVEAQNNGGSIQRFTIENMPSWMEITPSSGTINPSSSINISFEISEGLNIGSYNEVIYLTNEDNVSEALELTITVTGEKPDWVVNPTDFKFSMSVFGKMRFNNIFSSDKRDMLAAFQEGKCIGLTTSSYNADLDMWYALLTVYSNETQFENIEFRMWDASTGKIYLADAGRNINFINNSVAGTPANPIIFDGQEMLFQDITLNSGWNWISFNISTDALNDLNTTLVNLDWNSSNFFKSEADNLSANYSELQSKWIAEKTFTLNNLFMYKVSSSISQTLSLAGLYISPSSQQIIISANKWNYISYLPSVRLTLSEALAGYDAKNEDVIKSQTEFAMFAQNMGWVGNLSYMEPNKGYMLKRNDVAGTSFVYPNTSGSMGAKSIFIDEVRSNVNFNYSGNMNLVAISDIEPKWNDRILAYTGNVLNSETRIQNVNGELLYFITVSGEDDLEVSYALERDGEIIGIADHLVPFRDNSVSGTVLNPVVLKFIKEQTNISVYPNPIKDNLTISLLAMSTSNITMRILDITGREMISKTGSIVINELSETVIECSQLKPGVYLLYATVDGITTIHKIEKQ